MRKGFKGLSKSAKPIAITLFLMILFYCASLLLMYSKQAEVYICVFVPKSEASIDITESKKFTASVKGTYRVKIVAFDEAGNMSSVDYFVTVK